MRLVLGQDAIVTQWVRSQIPDADFGQCAAIGLATEDRLIAGCVYHNYHPRFRALEMSIAATTPTWARPEVISAFLRYPFGQLDCRRVTACVAARNKRARKFVERVGFRKEGCIRQGMGNDDCVIYGMLRAEAGNWLNRGD